MNETASIKEKWERESNMHMDLLCPGQNSGGRV